MYIIWQNLLIFSSFSILLKSLFYLTNPLFKYVHMTRNAIKFQFHICNFLRLSLAHPHNTVRWFSISKPSIFRQTSTFATCVGLRIKWGKTKVSWRWMCLNLRWVKSFQFSSQTFSLMSTTCSVFFFGSFKSILVGVLFPLSLFLSSMFLWMLKEHHYSVKCENFHIINQLLGGMEY